MASLQKTDRNGKSFYQIQFNIGDKGSRTTLRLGQIAQRTAREIFRHVDHLVSARKHGTQVREETEKWLLTIDSKLSEKLRKYGLVWKVTQRITVVEYAERFIKQKPDASEATVITYNNAKRHLSDFFGESKLLHEVSPAEAKEYYYWLRNHEKLAENTAKRRTGITRQIFNEALEAELISRNPFKQRSIKVAVGAGKKTYISKETILEND